MVSCRKVAESLSEYIDEGLDPTLQAEIAHHLRYCRRCSVLLDSVRKVMIISGDERTFEVPAGYETRLHDYLKHHIG